MISQAKKIVQIIAAGVLVLGVGPFPKLGIAGAAAGIVIGHFVAASFDWAAAGPSADPVGMLADLLASGRQNSVQALVEEITAEVRRFEDGTQQSDDITLLAVNFYGPKSQTAIMEG